MTQMRCYAAQCNCGHMPPDECDELQAQHERAGAIIRKLLEKTPGVWIRDIAKTVEGVTELG